MRKRKKLPDRRAYRRRTLRNLLLAAIAVFLLWMEAGYPLPQQMNFRRMERQRLLDRSEILMEVRGRMPGDRDILLGVTANHVHAAVPELGTLVVWDRAGTSPTLVALPEAVRYQERANSYLGPAFAAVDPPAGTASARLTLTLPMKAEGETEGQPLAWDEVYTVEGEPMGECFLFRLVNHYDRTGDQPEDRAESYWFDPVSPFSHKFAPNQMPLYTLSFYGGDGALLQEVTGGGSAEGGLVL